MHRAHLGEAVAQASCLHAKTVAHASCVHTLFVIMSVWSAGLSPCQAQVLLVPSDEEYTEQAAQRMVNSSRGRLATVYAPLAEQIVKDFDLAEKRGIGIDLGSGPGNLIIELCKRTRLHWVNADINPHFFADFFEAARDAGVGHRVSAIFADAQALPFRDNYADIIVSRGSFHFWKDKPRAFGEIYRVLKPGAVAFIGRGFSDNLPLETARRIRAEQKEGESSVLKYDVAETESELRQIMGTVGVADYRIRIPKVPGGEDVKYGIWVEFRKPAPRSGKAEHN